MKFIVITGFPATGKTTLSKKLSNHFNIPSFGKDDFKEILYDNFENRSIEVNKKFGKVSFEFLFFVAEENLKNNKSIIIEANFKAGLANKKLSLISELYSCKTIQIRCFADGNILYKRFNNRVNSKERHPAHLENNNKNYLQTWKQKLLKGKIEKLDFGNLFIDVDTTDFKKINYNEIIETIKSQNFY